MYTWTDDLHHTVNTISIPKTETLYPLILLLFFPYLPFVIREQKQQCYYRLRCNLSQALCRIIGDMLVWLLTITLEGSDQIVPQRSEIVWETEITWSKELSHRNFCIFPLWPGKEAVNGGNRHVNPLWEDTLLFRNILNITSFVGIFPFLFFEICIYIYNVMYPTTF